MPTIPQVNAKRNVLASPAAPFRDEAATVAENQNKVMGSVQKATQAWSDAHDLMQTSESKGVFSGAIADIQNRAADDPNYKNSAPYYKEIQQAKENSLKLIDNQFIRNQQSVEFDYDEKIAGLRLENEFKRKEIDYTRGVVLPSSIQGYQNNMALAGSQDEYNSQKDKMFSEIDAHAQKMIITQAEAYKLKKEAVFGAAENAIYSNPSRGIKLIDEGRFELDDKEKGILKDRATDTITRNQKIVWELQKDIFIKNEAKIAEDLSNGVSIDIPKLTKMANGNLISNDFLEAAIRVETSAASIGIETNSEDFSAVSEAILTSATKEELNAQLIKILRGGADGKISKNDMAILIKTAVNRLPNMVLKNPAMNSAAINLSDWADKNPKLDKADIMREFQVNIGDGKTIQEAVQATYKKYNVQLKPEIISHPNTGKVMKDKNGNKAIVYPDGRIEEMK